MPDVADIAWSPDDSMIASVGLDSTVFIWDGDSFGVSSNQMDALPDSVVYALALSQSSSRKSKDMVDSSRACAGIPLASTWQHRQAAR